jgi:alpha-L-fucosidase
MNIQSLKNSLAGACMAALAVMLPSVYGAPADDAALVVKVDTSKEPIADGPFKPEWKSLEDQYQVPDWFRNAKFGIWAHWSAQCVPEHGDWYARKMYEEGSDDYKFQIAHYGHPSKVGFKDLDHMWKAENWDADKLMDLYKRAGAKYFCALANHHDNFDCYDSKYQPWNSTKIGPMKDIVGTWAKAARDHGMRFGVSVHASHTWSWFEPSQGADKKGDLAGVPYDGKLTKADGAGTWWEGLDPQDLYAQNHVVGGLQWEWNPKKCTLPDQAYTDKFYNRTIDLVNKYHPDLLYFDDTRLPLYPYSDAGLLIAAHYYNQSLKASGKVDVVMTGKGLSEDERKGILWDLERGQTDHIEPLPWQTDTCIGDWHYDSRIFEKHKYKTSTSVIHTLLDNVSKNGNLQLSIPVKPDGTIDADEIAFLEKMADWMAINQECIFDTRPWTIFGEGPSAKGGGKGGGNFNEGKQKPLGAEDFRFTANGKTLYAIQMDWPKAGETVIKSLASGSENYKDEIGSVELLGNKSKLDWVRKDDGLHVTLPADKPCDSAFVFKIAAK